MPLAATLTVVLHDVFGLLTVTVVVLREETMSLSWSLLSDAFHLRLLINVTQNSVPSDEPSAA